MVRTANIRLAGNFIVVPETHSSTLNIKGWKNFFLGPGLFSDLSQFQEVYVS